MKSEIIKAAPAIAAALCFISVAISIPAFVRIKDRNDKGVIAATADAARGAHRVADALEKLVQQAAP